MYLCGAASGRHPRQPQASSPADALTRHSGQPKTELQGDDAIESSFPGCGHLLNQQFSAARPNQIWLGDIAYLATAEGSLYLAVLLDLYFRKMVG